MLTISLFTKQATSYLRNTLDSHQQMNPVESLEANRSMQLPVTNENKDLLCTKKKNGRVLVVRTPRKARAPELIYVGGCSKIILVLSMKLTSGFFGLCLIASAFIYIVEVMVL